MKILNQTLFLFIFSNITDQEKVILQTPWNIKGNSLFLKPWDPGTTLNESHITLGACWVQIYGLPIQFMTTYNAKRIGARL